MKAALLAGMVALGLLSTSVISRDHVADIPQCSDPRLEVVLFAQQPDIVHPVALAFEKRGRLLVVESHTHFRPDGYKGPAKDRIRILEDTDGDGKADKFNTFFEGTTATMDIVSHPDGSIYIATRNEILRLKETKGAGVADSQERIAFLDTKGNYPHNGISGLCFDLDGNLMFGLGENLGADYKLIGSDGITYSGGGEGGNIFICTADGKKLKRFATGFWNPFGIHVDSLGRIVTVDNDPDSMPPCRLIHVVRGGDYGYQFRYGRSGRHPFQAWNGQLPGTLPMICGTGEAPCEVLCYESDGLPREYFGNHFVTSWADHRVERYDLKEQGASFTTQQKVFVQGGKNFRPNGLAVASDGSLFIADWVLPDYNLHTKGAIWHLRPKQPLSYEKSTLPKLQKTLLANHPDLIQTQLVRAQFRMDEDVRKYLGDSYSPHVKVEAIPALKTTQDTSALLALATHADPFIRHAATMQLSQCTAILDGINWAELKPAEKTAVLLAQQRCGETKYQKQIPTYLKDGNEEVRFLAAKWISDQALEPFRSNLDDALARPDLNVRMTLALSTALARLDKQELSEQRLADRFVQKLSDDKATDSARLQWLRMIPSNHPRLSVKLLAKLAHSKDATLQTEAILSLCLHPSSDRLPLLKQLASDERLSSDNKLLASMTLSTEKPKPIAADLLKNRPPLEDTPAWLKRFGQNGNANAGRRVFYHPQGVGCSRCHQIDGRGNEIGPDLSTLGRNEPVRIMESLLQPSATVAPHYQAWTLVLHDGRILNGILAHTYLDEYTYLDSQGKPFKVKTHDVAETKASNKSIMPDTMLEQLTDQEIRDLLAFLFSRK